MKHKCSVVLGIVVLSLFVISQSHADLINLGKAGEFGLLGGSALTNTGKSVVNNGSVGSYPTSAVTGFTSEMINNGTLYTDTVADRTVTAQAHTDLELAYTAAKTATGGVSGPDLSGATLIPGVYIYGAALWTVAGTTLTLNGSGDPNAQWIFQIGSTLVTPAGASVVLSNGAAADHVFWAVGSTATLGADNLFAGNIMAQASINLGGGILTGRALAIDGTVAITTAETVNAGGVPEPGMMYTLVMVGVAGLALCRRRMRLDGRS